LKDVRFLVVDDFTSMRRVVRGLLCEMGHTDVEEADNGESALRELRAGCFDVVVTDVSMPCMDGFELLEAIRAEPVLRQVPVLMVTAEAAPEDMARAARCGASGYVIKPFTKCAFEAQVTRVLGKLGRSDVAMTQAELDALLGNLGRG